MKIKLILVALNLLFAFASCSDRRTVIGVSQCSNDTWRQKVNREIKIGQYKYKNVDVSFCSADNNAKRQVQQIDSLVESNHYRQQHLYHVHQRCMLLHQPHIRHTAQLLEHQLV